MGLIARSLEAAGITTVGLTSAWSITQAVNPPRSVFVDYPLGHTAGRPNDSTEQRQIIVEALTFAGDAKAPGAMLDLGLSWNPTGDQTWKDHVMRPSADSDRSGDHSGDDRQPRTTEPQFQFAEDAAEVQQNCASCIFLEDS